MSALAADCDGIAAGVNGGLVLHEGSHWLEGNAEVDVFPVADPSLNAS